MSSQENKVVFANQLRAIAVLAVVTVHWFGIYWLFQDVVSDYIFAPGLGKTSNVIKAITPPTVNYGPLGVAIFFIISGFVIPFSLRKSTPIEFIISRAFRIYPTYIVCSLIMLCVIWASAHYWGIPFYMDPVRFIVNLTLFQPDLDKVSIDLVNWTLAVEIKFYIICAFLYRFIRSSNPLPFVVFGVAVLAFCQWYPVEHGVIGFDNGMHWSIEALQWQLMCVVFMFIGTFFYFHYMEKISTATFICSALAMLTLFIMCWPFTDWHNQIPESPVNYVYGLIIFTAAYLFRHKFRPFAPLDFIAKISYPIYATHTIIGYSIMRILMGNGIPFLVSIGITGALIAALAYLIHIYIETPTMHMGKKVFSSAKPAVNQQGVA